VSIVEAEECATHARIVDVSRTLFEANASDAEIHAALIELIGFGLVQKDARMYCMTDAGDSLLLRCREGTRSQREHLEAVEKLLSARLTEALTTASRATR
jgi:hypothetical protein